MRGTHCLKMLFSVNLELHLSFLLIYLIFQSFWQVNASVGGIRAIYGLPLPLISSHCSIFSFLHVLILLFAAGY